MEVRPLRRYRRPTYPTRLEALADPKLLERHVPAPWRRNAELAGVVAVFVAANACVGVRESAPPPRADRAVVAPVFFHGEGRGITGCVVMLPPVFLSEEEALAVIQEELAKSGLEFHEKEAWIPDVTLPERTVGIGASEGRPVDSAAKVRTVPLRADLLDRDRRVAVEYVSTSDYFEMGGTPSEVSVQDFDFKAVAEAVAKAVEAEGEGVHFGVFYDPVPPVSADPAPYSDEWRELVISNEAWSEHMKARRPVGEEESRILLRRQVSDFVDWLKAQGAI